ncbi:AAA domain-containing protein [Pedobacter sp. JCM 36344]|uniref:AAA domain-containing protein n=1 Tax=Pedobacter sp. JCM 36344 TaxID=3374280 RepID=UPI00397E3C4A
MEYFDQLMQLLKIEKNADLKAYSDLTVSSSAAERRTNGLSWYPVAIRGNEIGRGDYLMVELERTTHQDINHQFRFGSSVALFSNHNAENDRIEGVVNFVGDSKLKISLQVDELPEWSRQGKLGVDLLFDNYTYDEMNLALKNAASLLQDSAVSRALKLPVIPLLKVLTGAVSPSFTTTNYRYEIPTLNEKQQEAVQKILEANELAIVHGPPGTGKTTTLVQAIKALIKSNGKQILVVAPSNTAVDLLTEKLADEGLEVLRIGNPARVSAKLLSLTIDGKMAEHESLKSIKKLKKQAAEYKKMAHKYKRSFGRAEQEQRKALFNEAHRILKEADNTEQYIIDQLLAKAQVITATLVGANHRLIKHIDFQTVIIDEAGQALEPGCWIPILKSAKLVLAGDHCQLSPTIKSAEAARKGLSKTLLEKAIALHPEAVVLLEEQYRMHKNIMGYSSGVFYSGLLKAHASVADRLLFSDDKPLQFIDTAGRGFEEKQEGTSVVNPDEANFLLQYLAEYIIVLKTHYDLKGFPKIGIIAPYQEQVKLLRAGLATSGIDKEIWEKITINTVDSFQGQERDIIYLSLTRSNDDQVIGFLSDIRRMNVAMTRAKSKLVIIGDSATLSKLPFYADFVSYADEKLSYHSAWEF